MKGNGMMGKNMVKVQKLILMEESTKGNSRMGNKMAKGHTFTMMEGSMKGNGRMGENGTEQDITKMGKSL